MRAAGISVVIAFAALAACGGDLDPPWQLDHDRIVAVRATPPAIQPGEQATVDGLIAVAGGPTLEASPEEAIVVSPMALAGALARADDGMWVVTAPDDDALAAARDELGLAAGAPVPLQLTVSYAGRRLVALKKVVLGDTAANPTLDGLMIDGAPAPAPGTELVIGSEVDVPLVVTAADTDDVNWLTSVGTMHDFDLPRATIRVEPEDPTDGELAVVVRDDQGGVTWQVWPLRAE